MKNLLIRTTTALLLTFVSFFAVAAPIWLDVRTAEEYSVDHVEGAINIPLQILAPESISEIFGKDNEIILYCRTGNRAGQAKAIFEQAGFTNVTNAGGLEEARELKENSGQGSTP